MAYNMKCNTKILWQASTKYARYQLHRALLTDEETGVEEMGFCLVGEHITQGRTIEYYDFIGFLLGDGLGEEHIKSVEFSDDELPPANKQEIEEFDRMFRKVGPRKGYLVLESEILLV